MSGTMTKPWIDADTWEQIKDREDFEPTCVIVLQFWIGGVIPGPKIPCNEPAKWVGFAPCCGSAVLVCNAHHAQTGVLLKCPPCNRFLDTLINWRPL